MGSAYSDFVHRLVKHELPGTAVGDRDICAQELCEVISGEALYTVPRSFLLLTVPGSPCFQQRIGDSSPGGIERYMRRPDTLSDLPLLAVTRLYTLRCTGGPAAVLPSRWRNPVVVRVVTFLLSARDGLRFEEYCLTFW